MNWIQKIWPRRSKAKSKPEASGALVPSYGQDLQHPDELINRANKRAVKGDLEGAIADFDAAIELNPAKATTYYNRGYLNNLAGNHEQALQDCSEAIALLPDYDEAFYQRGVAHQELGDLDAAIVDLSEVLRLNAFSIKAYYKRASCYAARDDVQGAVADYTQAILRVPKDANAYLQRGIFLTKLQEYRTAIADFASALSFNPKCADAYYHRGYCYAELGEKEKATQDFNQAMLYDPSQRVADYNRSYALGILKDTKNLPPASPTDVLDLSAPAVVQDDDAVVLSLSSDDPTILTAAPSNLPIQETLPDTPPRPVKPESEPLPTSVPSASIVSSALGSQPSGALVRQSEVEVLFATAQHQAQADDFEAAIATYSEILEVEPHNARAYFERGRSLNAIGRGDAAADDADKAVTLAKQKSLDLMKNYNSTLAETLADLKGGLEWEYHPASALVDSNQQNNQSIEGAILKYSQLIHRNPLDVRAYFERAKSRAILGDLEGAIADYTRTIALDETYRDAYYKRGILLSALGDADGATRDMNKAILRKPLLPAAPPASSVPLRESPLTSQSVSTHMPPSDVNETERAMSIDPDEPVDHPGSTVIENEPASESAAPAAATAVSQMDLPRDMERDASPESLDASEFTEKVEPIEEEGLEPDKKIETMKSTYISDLMLEPCTHEGNDPAHRFCIFCGQPIHSTQ